jgi:hypothetical protein
MSRAHSVHTGKDVGGARNLPSARRVNLDARMRGRLSMSVEKSLASAACSARAPYALSLAGTGTGRTVWRARETSTAAVRAKAACTASAIENASP